MKTKKLLLSLGTSAVLVAPVAAVVSCSSDKAIPLTADQIKINAKLLSASSQIENTYQEKVLKDQYDTIAFPTTVAKQDANGDYKTDYVRDSITEVDKFLNSQINVAGVTSSVLDLAKYYVRITTYANRSYLKTLATNLLGQDKSKLVWDTDAATPGIPVPDAGKGYEKITSQDIQRYSLLDDITQTGVSKVFSNDPLFKELIQVMISKDNEFTGFKNEFYRFLISLGFLNVSKTNYNNVFFDKTKNEDTYQNATTDGTDADIKDDANYLLIKETFKTKPFFSWTATLDESKSKAYRNQVDLTGKDVDAFMTKGGASELPVGLSTQNKVIDNDFKALASLVDPKGAANLDKFLGYQGLKTQSSIGNKSLSFSTSQMKKVNDTTVKAGSPTGTAALSVQTLYDYAYNGYIFKNEVMYDVDPAVDNAEAIKINLIPSGAKAVSVTKTIGIVPTWSDSKGWLLTQFSTPAEKLQLEEALYTLDAKEIYSNAITYYTHRIDDPSTPNVVEKRIKLKVQDEYLKTIAVDRFGFTFIFNKDKDTDENTK